MQSNKEPLTSSARRLLVRDSCKLPIIQGNSISRKLPMIKKIFPTLLLCFYSRGTSLIGNSVRDFSEQRDLYGFLMDFS